MAYSVARRTHNCLASHKSYDELWGKIEEVNLAVLRYKVSLSHYTRVRGLHAVIRHRRGASRAYRELPGGATERVSVLQIDELRVRDRWGFWLTYHFLCDGCEWSISSSLLVSPSFPKCS